jgi:uroporphyrinogen-III synthase
MTPIHAVTFARLNHSGSDPTRYLCGQALGALFWLKWIAHRGRDTDDQAFRDLWGKSPISREFESNDGLCGGSISRGGPRDVRISWCRAAQPPILTFPRRTLLLLTRVNVGRHERHDNARAYRASLQGHTELNPAIVLTTRPEPGATETAARVEAMGLTPIVAPVLVIRPLPVHLPPPGRIAAVLLPSGNAVDPLPAPYRGLPLLTVGAATAKRARQAGFTDVASADGDAPALAALVRTRFEPGDGTLLLPAGRGQSLTLAGELRASGFRVARRVVYAAEPVDALPEAAKQALIGDRPLAVLFFSAETARCFMRLVRAEGIDDRLHGRDAVAIGAKAGEALKGGGWARVRVAGKPTQDDMLALLR